MRTQHCLFVAVAALFLMAGGATFPQRNSSSDFILRSCETTQFPQLCFRSLAAYANAVQDDPARLAFTAVRLSFSRAKRMYSYLAALRGGPSAYHTDPQAAAAVRDCRAVYGDALDLILGSLKQMRAFSAAGGDGGLQLRFQMSSVQTWMSAALTNEDTCKDGLEGVPDGPVKLGISQLTAEVTAVTSNALALVNAFVAKTFTP